MFDFFKRKKAAAAEAEPKQPEAAPAETESGQSATDTGTATAETTEAAETAGADVANQVNIEDRAEYKVTPVAAPEPAASPEPVDAPAQPTEQPQDKPLDNQKKPGFFSRIRAGLSKTRQDRKSTRLNSSHVKISYA